MSDESSTKKTLRRWVDHDESATITTGKRVEDLFPPLENLPRLEADLVIRETIAEGGMGRILLARQTSLARDVAVKTALNETKEEQHLLVREALVTGALEHPSIIPIHGLGVDADGHPRLVMKRVEGVTWRALLSDPAHPAWTTHLGATGDRLEANLAVLTSICRALELAHARGILHRDIKPDNVMLGPFGEVYLLDWGLAARSGTREDDIVGTPAYMAPELASCEPSDETTDVYLLGATLHRVLMGRARHATGQATDTILAASLSAPVTYPPSVPASLAQLCNDACALSKRERPESVQAFRERLTAFGRERSALAICDVARDRLTRLARLLETAAPKPPADLAHAYRLATEARFGFGQALAAFPEQADARTGVTASVEALVELELRQDHVDTAAALATEAPGLAAKFEARFAAARAASAATAEEDDRLRALGRDMDPAIGIRARTRIFVLLFGFQTAIAIAFGRPGHELDLATGSLVAGAGGTLLMTGVIVLALRRRIFATQLGRRAMSGLVAIEGAVLLCALVGHFRHEDIHRALANELLVTTAGVSLTAALILPRLGYAIPICLVATVAIEGWPQATSAIFLWSMCIVGAISMWSVMTQDRETERRARSADR